MTTTTGISTAASAVGVWDRRRLQRTLAGVTALAVLLLAGLAYAIQAALATEPQTAAAQAASVGPVVVAVEDLPDSAARRDAIAAAPMLAVPPDAARGGTPAQTRAEPIAIPASGRVGPANVPTGYPQTPEGAIGQLAAITAATLQSLSLDDAADIYAAWTEPGAPPASDWTLMRNLRSFLGSDAAAHLTDPSTALIATPVAAQVKGIDGDTWTLACVLMHVEARVVTTARMGYGHCARMHWTDDASGGRWVIGAGAEPAAAPSTWPGTELAKEAGWRTWVPAEN
ncbi:hypothetical protein GA707_19550 [Nostocoides sp. F2B08]|uniref:hypothetical protein n=1 Tax=Nostocoides sp. F2B08 TaxID=2653936 RepID=UPI001263933D|nr:hypothetical protein [Tetrasphaera sp. F2B08]KAB7740351.1 hypothetical protein GA707_19550 [Tetrasphaera sp. F2B08]